MRMEGNPTRGKERRSGRDKERNQRCKRLRERDWCGNFSQGSKISERDCGREDKGKNIWGEKEADGDQERKEAHHKVKN